MPIFIRNPELDQRLDRLATQQTMKCRRTPLAESILDHITKACVRSGNPEAWREIGGAAPLPSKGVAQQNSNSPASVPASKPNSPLPCGSERASAGGRRRARKQSA